MPSPRRGLAALAAAVLLPAGLGVIAAPAHADPTPQQAGVKINEFRSNDTAGGQDFVELYNSGTSMVDLTGWHLTDADGLADHDLVLDGQIAAGGFAVLYTDKSPVDGSSIDGGFGLGKGETVSLYLPDSTTQVDTVTAPASTHAQPSYARTVDGAGTWAMSTAATIGSPNTASPATAGLVISEVETNGANQDFVELFNGSAAAITLTGLHLTDADGIPTHDLVLSGSLPAGAYTAIYTDKTADGSSSIPGGFGLGKGETVSLYGSDSTTLIDRFVVPAGTHADPSWARSGFGNGLWRLSTGATPGAANTSTPTADVPCDTEAPGPTTNPVTGALAWPGEQTVSVADDQCAWIGGGSGQDLSGLVFDPIDPDVLWAVKNKSVVYKLARTDGIWRKVTTDGWANGKSITFPSGTGLPDSEGLTVGPDGALYITTERDNAASPQPPLDTILRFDPDQSGTTLTASDEWDLTDDVFPARDSADANLGFEGVTYVPDSYLTSNGFIDDSTGRFYSPSTYPDKLTAGLFFAAVEKTGHLRAYALNADHTYTRVADIDTGMAGVMDVSYDADLQRIWAQCDNTCGVVATLLQIGSDGHFSPVRHFSRPAGLPDNNLEGFAVAPASTAVDGEREVVWSDDGNFGTSTTGVATTAANGGHSLWSGLMDVDLGLGGQGYVPIPQQVTFTTTPPAAAVVGQTYAVGATAPGGPVTLTAGPASVCSLAGATVTLAHPGTCTVTASQDGGGYYAPASVSQAITVGKAATAVTGGKVPGGYRAEVSVLAPGAGTADGTVQLWKQNKLVGTATLTDGAVTVTDARMPGVSATVRVVYLGSADFAGSTSAG